MTQSNDSPQSSSTVEATLHNVHERSDKLPQGPLTHGQVTSDTVLSSLQNGGDPLDFIKRNLRPTPTPGDTNGAAISVQPPVDGAAKLPDTPQVKYDVNGQPIGENKDGENKPGEVEPGDSKTLESSNAELESSNAEDGELEGESGETPAAENFKKLRTKLRETSSTLKTLQTEKESLAQELESYKNGVVVPEVIQEKENEIARLSRFEKLHNLKMSPGYQEKFVKPLSELRGKLGVIAKDYEIPTEVLEQALTLEKRSDLNRFLSQHFDELGALEVRELLDKTKTLEAQCKEAQKEPESVLQELTKEHDKIETQRSEERLTSIKTRAQDAWVKSLNKIRQEGKIHELIFKENDPEHNEKFTKPILTKASQEYGKLVTLLANNGLRELPEELAIFLANMTALGHASAVSIVTRAAAEDALSTLKTNTSRTNGMIRPQIGGSGSGGSGGGPPPKMPNSPTEAAQVLLDKVMRR